MQLIVDAPPLKEGSGKELQQLHDTVQQHFHALKTLRCNLPGQFITSMIELKLDIDTLFEWQKHSQVETNVCHYEALLEFRVQALKSSHAILKKQSQSSKKPHGRVTSFTANSEVDSNYTVCKTDKHPLYLCAKFKAMSYKNKTQANRLCINSLSAGHFKAQCKSAQGCRICQRAHHTLLHLETSITLGSKPPESRPPESRSPEVKPRNPPSVTVGSTPAASGLRSNLQMVLLLKSGHY